MCSLLSIPLFCSVAQLCPTLQLCGLHAACQASLSFTIFPSLLRFVFIELVVLSNYLILYRPLLPSFFPSIRWPKYWNFSFSISFSNEYSGLISFRIAWFDLAVQGTLQSLFQHHNLEASILWSLHWPISVVRMKENFPSL